MKKSIKSLTITLAVTFTIIITIVGFNLIGGYFSSSYDSFRGSINERSEQTHLEIIREVPTESKTIVILLNKRVGDIQLYNYEQNRSGTKFINRGWVSLVPYDDVREKYRLDEYDITQEQFYPNMFFGAVSLENKEKIRVDGQIPSFIHIDVRGEQFAIWYVENVTAASVKVSFEP